MRKNYRATNVVSRGSEETLRKEEKSLQEKNGDQTLE